ncbi:MAG: hypothetical protein EA342_08610 [Leptolyngbya sp. LCM1.Bin17]|nr:MAG: hypothetical protein EA342_08610 [Leptolyngbya sp. LCM1.Bin17]
MSQTIVNLTLPTVTEKIDAILAIYIAQGYFSDVDHHDLRQRLAAYVLSRLPVVYVTMDSTAACSLESPSECYSPAQHEQMSRLIHQGIEVLLRMVTASYDHRDRELADTGASPSNWFG